MMRIRQIGCSLGCHSRRRRPMAAPWADGSIGPSSKTPPPWPPAPQCEVRTGTASAHPLPCSPKLTAADGENTAS